MPALIICAFLAFLMIFGLYFNRMDTNDKDRNKGHLPPRPYPYMSASNTSSSSNTAHVPSHGSSVTKRGGFGHSGGGHWGG